MKTKLIINADDFGLTAGVNEGIIESFKNGVVTSTTLMVNQPNRDEAIALAKDNPKLGVGLHLTFDKGKALSGVSSLTDEHGNLKNIVKLLEQDTKEEDFYKEIITQYKEFKKLMGKEPTHIDSHHHIHIRNPKAFLAMKNFCTAKNIKYRSNENFINRFYGPAISEELFIQLIEEKKKENRHSILEIMTHPGKNDEFLEQTSSYTTKREEEIRILTDTNVKNYIRNNFISINFLGEEK